MRLRWGDSGGGLSPKSRQLLQSAAPLRKMSAAEQARANAFIASLPRRSPFQWSGFVFGAWQWRIALVCATLCVFVAMKMHQGWAIDEPAPLATPTNAERYTVTPHLGFASLPAEPISPGQPQSTWGLPGAGDICGQRVCESMPSCCEEQWDDACDRKLLELTRLPMAGISMQNVGRCYWHDREFCADCACPAYVKRTEVFAHGSTPGVSLGYDGGSGCVRSPTVLLENIHWMCVQGFCEE